MIVFAVIQGGGRLRAGDTLLFVVIGVAGLGYAEGGTLAREYGGWRVICWAVLLALPVTLPVTAVAAIAAPRPVSAGAVAGLCYGGVARIGRLQLAQPALTLGWSALLLSEPVGWLSAAAAAAVIAATAVGRKRPPHPIGPQRRGTARPGGSGVLARASVREDGIEKAPTGWSSMPCPARRQRHRCRGTQGRHCGQLLS